MHLLSREHILMQKNVLTCINYFQFFPSLSLFVIISIDVFCLFDRYLQFLMQGKAGQYAPVFEKYQEKAEFFMCSCLGKGTRNIQRSPGGVLFRQRWNNLQFVTSASFLMTVYSDYLASSGRSLRCAAGNVQSAALLSFAKSQVMEWKQQPQTKKIVKPYY